MCVYAGMSGCHPISGEQGIGIGVVGPLGNYIMVGYFGPNESNGLWVK